MVSALHSLDIKRRADGRVSEDTDPRSNCAGDAPNGEPRNVHGTHASVCKDDFRRVDTVHYLPFVQVS